MKTIILETVIAIVLFTAGVAFAGRNPLNIVYNMPQPIIDRCIELGLVGKEQQAYSPSVKRRKMLAAILICLALALIIYYLNHAKSFAEAFLISYGIWCIVDWYDCIVMDWIWFCHDPHFIIPGTEDLTEAYHDYRFHALGSLKGMLIGLPVCLLTALIVQIMNWVK